MSATDYDEITRIVNLYIEGAAKGDAAMLDEAFHDSAHWFGYMHDTEYAVDKHGFIELIVSQPGDTGSLVSEILSIEQTGSIANAVVHDTAFWGDMEFTDFFQLVNFNGTWKIVSKAFHLH